MGRQRGPLRIEGTHEDLTFYKINGHYTVKLKSVVPKSTRAHSPAFARTRENSREFGTASQAASLILQALREIVIGGMDSYVKGRLTARSREVLATDAFSPRGQRSVANGDLSLYTGFNFNKTASLSATAFVDIAHSTDRAAGSTKVNLPAYVPATRIHGPEGATHYRFLLIGAEFSFSERKRNAAATHSAYLPLSRMMTMPLSLTASLQANSPHSIFLCLGIEFYQLVNDEFYPVNDGRTNPMQVLQVDA